MLEESLKKERCDLSLPAKKTRTVARSEFECG